MNFKAKRSEVIFSLISSAFWVMYPTLLIISILISSLDVNNHQQVTKTFEIVSLSSCGFALIGALVAFIDFYITKNKYYISILDKIENKIGECLIAII